MFTIFKMWRSLDSWKSTGGSYSSNEPYVLATFFVPASPLSAYTSARCMRVTYFLALAPSSIAVSPLYNPSSTNMRSASVRSSTFIPPVVISAPESTLPPTFGLSHVEPVSDVDKVRSP